jgi:hypothetical protein
MAYRTMKEALTKTYKVVPNRKKKGRTGGRVNTPQILVGKKVKLKICR